MTTYTSQPDETSGLDTYISAIYGNVNYGNQNSIAVGKQVSDTDVVRGLIKFDISSIPVGAIVISATLSLTISGDDSSNARTMRVYRQKKAWTEAGATWNKYDGTNNWTSTGGFNSADCEQTEIGSVSLTASETVNTTKDITLLTSSIQEMVLGTFTNNGFFLKMDTENNDAYRWHSSGATTASYRPKLVINYDIPGAQPVAITPYMMI